MKIARNIILIPGAVFVFLFGFPILGAFSAFKLASWLGCSLSARASTECMFLGMDIGERLYGYAVPFVGAPLTPIAFLSGFWDIFLVWGALSLGLHLAYKSSSGIANKSLKSGDAP
jgi:hypothetical protein